MTTMTQDDTEPTAVEGALADVETVATAAAGSRVARPRPARLAAVAPEAPLSGTREVRPPARRTAPSEPRTRPAGPVAAARAGGSARPRLRLVPAPEPLRVPAAPAPAPPPVLAERLRRLAAVDRAPGADDDERSAAPGTDAGRFAHGVGLACVEVVLGRRPAAQLARWVAPAVLESLSERADLVRRAGVLAHARRPAARRVRVCAVDAVTAEACLVVDDGVRVRAVALRLEAHRGAWRVTTLEIG